ncbi:MAG: hypothetical protein AB8G99_27475 [Planctomycetaceae bacterium]
MQSESSGTITAIFMLIPLVTVPYFAIRGTKDLDGLPSASGQDEVVFDSSDGFDDDGIGGEAPPFPTDDSVVQNQTAIGNDPAEGWNDPFGSPQAVPFGPGNLSGGVGAQLDQQQKRGRAPLERTGDEKNGEEDFQLADHEEQTDSNRTVAQRWETGIQKLQTAGMRNYRVESLRDKSMYFVTAFFPGKSGSGVMRRFEGEGKHPLNALKSVMDQVTNWRRNSLAR